MEFWKWHRHSRLGVSDWFYKVGYRTLKLLDSDEREFIKELRKRWEEKHPECSFRMSARTGLSLGSWCGSAV